MKVKDAQRWAQTQSDLQATEESKAFLEFVTIWADGSEEFMARKPEVSAVDALRATLISTEEHLDQPIGVNWIGQMLAVLSMHWVHAETFAKELTPLEFRLFEEAYARQLVNLQLQAQAAAGQGS
ncbi:hypothetical protein SEA_SKOG_200 [Gordonia phage Skog]|uniref:Uncharacterized protein n=1 Tax=Gordonia phage Skog TaxID=2704033 RepID=A0A6G6XJS6_9CAUD|nr:hypothetical protein KHQ85_gp200 [Gordonia phage Skog]QIG58352.1 hypothetical protein SEA_SKOG_200 [Gordonia phage Skog]